MPILRKKRFAEGAKMNLVKDPLVLNGNGPNDDSDGFNLTDREVMEQTLLTEAMKQRGIMGGEDVTMPETTWNPVTAKFEGYDHESTPTAQQYIDNILFPGAGSGGISSLTSDLNDDGKVDANDLLNLLESDYLNDSRLTKMQSEYGKEETPWSAALVSSLAGYMDPTFVKSARHSDYIGRAFRGEGNYVPQKLHSNKIINGKEEFKVGDILFGGRKGQTSYGKGYNWYKRKGRGNKGYGSHGDIIVDTGVDKNGRWYDIQGGNMSNQLYSRRVYAKDFETWGRNYRGKLTV